VNTDPGFEAPVVWPANGSATRRLLSSVGFPLVEFPDFSGNMRRSDSLVPISRRFFCIRFAIPRLRLCFAPAGPARVTGEPGVGDPGSRPDMGSRTSTLVSRLPK
jgi:hypothetical protein